MFLATLDVLGPVARVRFLVVQQSADAQLFGGGAVPASPVTRARSLVTEYAVQPVAVVAGYGSVCGKKLLLQQQQYKQYSSTARANDVQK